MTIDELNRLNRNHMKERIHNEGEMSWNDDTLMDILLGHLPQIRSTRKDNTVYSEIRDLTGILAEYRYECTNRDTFLEDATQAINRIKQIEPYWYGISSEEISYFLAMQRFCVINGYGGMGKSYFIFRLEEQLTNESIPHLCVYGKYQKTIDNIDFAEIHFAAERGLFLLVVDALNEMEDKTQKELIKMLEGLCNCRGLRVILTYRTHKLSADIIAKLEEMSSYQYVFTGVSYESALEMLMCKPVLNVYKYESILYTNNPFYLQILCKILEKPKLEKESINSFSTLTYILENYIKETIGKKHWQNTKTVTQWMYENRSRIITRVSICGILENPDDYINAMKQYGLLGEMAVEGSIRYAFTIETLTDFLLARYFIKEIQGVVEEEQVRILKQRSSEFVNMDEAFIISLFDLTKDYDLIKRLLIGSGLFDSFNLEMISHINFTPEDIQSFQKAFRVSHTEGLISIVGGYNNKPYNCISFLNERYIRNQAYQFKELSSALSGTLHMGRLTERLKNMVYFVSIVKANITEEMFWFALWCTAAPDPRTRCYAIKLLYEMLQKEPKYIDKVITQWNSFSDYFIQEGIVQTLSLLSFMPGHGIEDFFSRYKDEPYYHSARCLKRIGKAQGAPYQYIELEKENLYHYSEAAVITEELDALLCHISLIDETLLPFRYWFKDHIEAINRFIQGPKELVASWNNVLLSKFSCVEKGECNGSFSFEQWAKSNYPATFSLEKLDKASFVASFGVCIKEVMRQYGVDVFEQNKMETKHFSSSICRKVIDIAVDIYYGSVMCNYYTDQFASFNNIQNSIGMEVYDPIEYEEEELHIASPVPTYASTIEILGDALLSAVFKNDACFDEAWSKDEEQSISTLKQLLQPISYKKREWVLLNAKIRIARLGRVECYDIHCCTDSDIHLTGMHEDRYMTIELPNYYGVIDRYALSAEQASICKEIPSISGRHDWFDETELMFPPAQIVRDLGLRYNIPSMSWNTVDGDAVVFCDNNKNSYLQSEISSAVFMRKDYYDTYTVEHPVHYFCYTEKMLEGKTFTDEASLHLELKDGELVHKFYNADEQNQWLNEANRACNTCPYGFVSTGDTDPVVDREAYLKLLKQYE